MRKIILIMMTCILASCSTSKELINIDHKIRKIDIGMTKRKVVSILGDDYEITSSRDKTFVLGYKSSNNGIYKFIFIDGKLKEWNKDYIRNSGSLHRTSKK